MTSGNAATSRSASRTRSAPSGSAAIADAVLVHDREVVARYDDSVDPGAGRVTWRRASCGAHDRRLPRRSTSRCDARRRWGPAPSCTAPSVSPTGQGVPLPARRRPRHRGVDGAPTATRSSGSGGLRDRARARRARPAPGLHDDAVRGLRSGCRPSPCSTTTRTSPRRWPSTGWTARCSASRSTGSVWARTAPSGAASSWCAAPPDTAGSAASDRWSSPAGTRPSRDPVRMALAHAAMPGVLDAAIDRLAAHVRARRRGRAADRVGARLASDQLGGPPVRRGGRDRGRVPIRQLRGAARDAARSRRCASTCDTRCSPRSCRRRPDGLLELDTRPLIVDAFELGRRGRTVPRRVRGADRRRPRSPPRPTPDSTVWCSAAASSRTTG